MSGVYKPMHCIQYDIVGVRREATKDEIIKACRIKTKQFTKQ